MAEKKPPTAPAQFVGAGMAFGLVAGVLIGVGASGDSGIDVVGYFLAIGAGFLFTIGAIGEGVRMGIQRAKWEDQQ